MLRTYLSILINARRYRVMHLQRAGLQTNNALKIMFSDEARVKDTKVIIEADDYRLNENKSVMIVKKK